MFAVLVSGRLVQTNFQQVSANQIVFQLDNATAIHHISVFMTGQQPLPEGFGTVIYFAWPPYQQWKYCGWIGNVKPSAIFRVSQAQDQATAAATDPAMQNHSLFQMQGFSLPQHMVQQNISAQIGLQIMDLATIQHQFGDQKTEPDTTPHNMAYFCEKMLTSFYNYASSFVRDIPNGLGGTAKVLEATIFDKWYQAFKHRLQVDPNFWKDK